MDSHRKTSSASQNPPPGSYPESTAVGKAPSVASTTVQVRNEVREILDAVKAMPCTLQGVSSVAIEKKSWKELEQKLISCMEKQNKSIPVHELAELQRELSHYRLLANDFKSAKERAEYALESLTQSLNRAKANEAKAQIEAEESLALLSGTQQELRATLAALQAQKKEYEAAIKASTSAGSEEDTNALLADKRRLSVEIQNLNNSLQSVNSDKKAVQDKVKRFERQVLELTVQLNAEKSRAAIQSNSPGTSFAEVAKKQGNGLVNLVNPVWTNLPKLAKARFDKIKEDPTSDERNTVFWLKAALDATHHAVYKPYKLVFDGLAEDLSLYTVPSRKAFDQFLVAVRDSFLPTGQPLSHKDLNDMLSRVDVKDLRMNKHYRERGFKTLAQLLAHNLAPAAPDASDFPYRLVDGKVILDKGKQKAMSPPSSAHSSVSELSLRPLSPPSPFTGPVQPSIDDTPKEPSLWRKAKAWLKGKFGNMNARIRRSLKDKPNRLITYFKLANGNLFQRLALVPYSWFIWCCP